MSMKYELSEFPLITKQSTTIAAIVRSVDTNPTTQAVILTFSDASGWLGSLTFATKQDYKDTIRAIVKSTRFELPLCVSNIVVDVVTTANTNGEPPVRFYATATPRTCAIAPLDSCQPSKPLLEFVRVNMREPLPPLDGVYIIHELIVPQSESFSWHPCRQGARSFFSVAPSASVARVQVYVFTNKTILCALPDGTLPRIPSGSAVILTNMQVAQYSGSTCFTSTSQTNIRLSLTDVAPEAVTPKGWGMDTSSVARVTPSKRGGEETTSLVRDEVDFAEGGPTYEEVRHLNEVLQRQLASTAAAPPKPAKKVSIAPIVVLPAVSPSPMRDQPVRTPAHPSKKSKKDDNAAPANAIALPQGYIGKHHEGDACWSAEHGAGVVKGGGAVRLTVKFASVPVEKSVKVEELFLMS